MNEYTPIVWLGLRTELIAARDDLEKFLGCEYPIKFVDCTTCGDGRIDVVFSVHESDVELAITRRLYSYSNYMREHTVWLDDVLLAIDWSPAFYTKMCLYFY
jgi:hypothetical protein